MTGSAMKLLDLSDHLPGLPRLPGLKKWYARDKIQYYSNWEEASQVRIVHLLTCNPSSQFSHFTQCGSLHVSHDSCSHVGKQMLDTAHSVQIYILQFGPGSLSACLRHTVCWLQQTLFAARLMKHDAADVDQLLFCRECHVCLLSVSTAWPACSRTHTVPARLVSCNAERASQADEEHVP